MERGNNNLIITEKILTLINLERQIWKLKLREGTLRTPTNDGKSEDVRGGV